MKTFSNFILEANSCGCNKSPEGSNCPSHGLMQCPGFKKFKSPEEIAKKHRLDVSFVNKQLESGIKIEKEHTKDKEKAREIALQHLEEIPDYYTRLKKMESGAKKEHKKFKDVKEERKSGDYSLHDWFSKSKSSDGKPGWVQLGGPYAGKPCARQPGQKSTPKCGSSKMAKNLSAKEEERAFNRKNRQDPDQPQKTGGAKPTNVRTEETILEKKDACYHKVKSRYKVWPSAYASGALVKCRKKGAKNWGTKSESAEALAYEWDGPIYQNEKRYCPKCQRMERMKECKYGHDFWLRYSSAVEPSSKVNYDITPFQKYNEEKIYNKTIEEDYTKIQTNGKIYGIMSVWRGKTIFTQIFFPQLSKPTREQVSFEINKIYPGARVISFLESIRDQNKPLLFVGDCK